MPIIGLKTNKIPIPPHMGLTTYTRIWETDLVNLAYSL